MKLYVVDEPIEYQDQAHQVTECEELTHSCVFQWDNTNDFIENFFVCWASCLGDGSYYTAQYSTINTLARVCRITLINHCDAPKVLPTTSGVYDDRYFEQVFTTYENICRILKTVDHSQHFLFSIYD